MASFPTEPLLFGLFHAIFYPGWIPRLSVKANVCWNKMRLCAMPAPTKCSVLVRHNIMQTKITHHQLIATNQFQTTTRFSFCLESRCWLMQVDETRKKESKCNIAFTVDKALKIDLDIIMKIYNPYKCWCRLQYYNHINLFCQLPNTLEFPVHRED